MRLILPFAISLTACAPAAELSSNATSSDIVADACGAAVNADLIGQPVQTVETGTLARVVRILPPGSMMTMDYHPDRLNIDTDAGGAITRLWCG